jgi:hypothetical protein
MQASTKCKKIEIIPCTLTDQHALKLELNKKTVKNMQTVGN